MDAPSSLQNSKCISISSLKKMSAELSFSLRFGLPRSKLQVISSPEKSLIILNLWEQLINFIDCCIDPQPRCKKPKGVSKRSLTNGSRVFWGAWSVTNCDLSMRIVTFSTLEETYVSRQMLQMLQTCQNKVLIVQSISISKYELFLYHV